MINLKITMIHDIVCSWCHIGYAHLHQALVAMQNEVTPRFDYVPFQLNPNLGRAGVEINQHLRARNRWSEQEAKDYRSHLLAVASLAGAEIDFSRRTHYYNTAKAHALLLLAQQEGVQRWAHELLLHAYHVEGKNIADTEALLPIGQAVGLRKSAVIAALNAPDLQQRLQQKIQAVAQLQPVNSVPAFVFNNEIFVSGSNSTEFFITLIRQNIINKVPENRRVYA